jgi:subtilisin family serine protease
MATDRHGHGTHVAGILAARSNNAQLGDDPRRESVSGVAASKLHKLRVWKIFGDTPVNDDYEVDGDAFGVALTDAMDSGIRALNLSIGGPIYSTPTCSAIEQLVENGVTVVAAMGNDGVSDKEYPAAYEVDGLIAVGAVNERLDRSEYSNTGEHLDLVAPGDNILSTTPHRRSGYGPDFAETGYDVMSGTSMATPYVTAVAALVASKYPSLKPAQVETHLRQTCTRLPGMGKRRRTDDYGHGLLNVQAALETRPS